MIAIPKLDWKKVVNWSWNKAFSIGHLCVFNKWIIIVSNRLHSKVSGTYRVFRIHTRFRVYKTFFYPQLALGALFTCKSYSLVHIHYLYVKKQYQTRQICTNPITTNMKHIRLVNFFSFSLRYYTIILYFQKNSCVRLFLHCNNLFKHKH